jgi:hypothetical protein
LNGALIPHAPLLLEEVVAGGESLREIREGIARVNVPADTTVLVASPHGGGPSFYARPSGSLAGFGIEAIEVEPPTAAADVTEILQGWAGDTVEEPLDHGSVVPLRLLGVTQATAAVSVGSDASGLARAIAEIASTQDVFVICSAHTSARLTERAPLPYSFDAVRLDARFVSDIEQDCAAAVRGAPELETVGGSCSGATLSLFGELFAGRPAVVQAYASPFGVGYPVVTAELDG